jgi:hypothetical protein
MLLSILPWGLVVLGLLPLGFFPSQDALYPGIIFLLGALIMAAAASLYARSALEPRTRFCWVLGLAIVANVLAVDASRELSVLPHEIVTVAAVGSLLAGVVFLAGLGYLATSTRRVPTGERNIMDATALQSLAPSLEGLAAAMPLTLLLIHTEGEPGENLLQWLRQPDMVFKLQHDHYLVVLQSGLEGAQIAFRRLRQGVTIRAYALSPLQGKTINRMLHQLEVELEHYYLAELPA